MTGNTECSQCGKPAVGVGGGQPLCLACIAKLQEIYSQQNRDNLEYVRHLGAMMNYIQDQATWATGLGIFGPRLAIPAPAPQVHQGPISVTTLDIDGSTIGLLNTGQVQDVGAIDIRLSELERSGQEELVQALKALTEAVVKDDVVDSATKDELLDQLAELASQAALPPQSRMRQGAIRGILSSLGQTLGALGGLSEVWSTFGGTIKGFF